MKRLGVQEDNQDTNADIDARVTTVVQSYACVRSNAGRVVKDHLTTSVEYSNVL